MFASLFRMTTFYMILQFESFYVQLHIEDSLLCWEAIYDNITI